MSEKMLCDIADLVAIADVTRSLNGSSDKYYLDELVTEVQNVAKTAEQATPSISVDSNGKITSTATQNAGFVKGGSKTATKQLSTQGAQTITPGTYDKTISSGKYLTGDQIIKGDYNLVPENIREGVSIFGVNGNMSGGNNSNYVSFIMSSMDMGNGGFIDTCNIYYIDSISKETKCYQVHNNPLGTTNSVSILANSPIVVETYATSFDVRNLEVVYDSASGYMSCDGNINVYLAPQSGDATFELYA